MDILVEVQDVLTRQSVPNPKGCEKAMYALQTVVKVIGEVLCVSLHLTVHMNNVIIRMEMLYCICISYIIICTVYTTVKCGA